MPWVRRSTVNTATPLLTCPGSILFGWLHHEAEQTIPNPVTVTFSGLKNEAHQVVWYSDRSGKVLRCDAVSGPGATLSVPSSFFGDPDPNEGGQHLAANAAGAC